MDRPTDAIDAVHLLETSLETLRASSPSWAWPTSATEKLGAAIMADPRVAELAVALLSHRRECGSSLVGKTNAMVQRIEETLDQFRGRS